MRMHTLTARLLFRYLHTRKGAVANRVKTNRSTYLGDAGTTRLARHMQRGTGRGGDVCIAVERSSLCTYPLRYLRRSRKHKNASNSELVKRGRPMTIATHGFPLIVDSSRRIRLRVSLRDMHERNLKAGNKRRSRSLLLLPPPLARHCMSARSSRAAQIAQLR